MGVYINMEMPKSCRDCRFCNGQANTDYGVCAWCDVDGKARDAYTMQDCPLVPIPPHGRLIDANALVSKIQKALDAQGDSWIKSPVRMAERAMRVADFRQIKNAPTIIPAEGGDAE